MPRARHDAGGDAVRGRRRGDRPELRRPPDAEPLGAQGAQHRVGRRRRPARSSCRRSARRGARIARSCSASPRGSRTTRSCFVSTGDGTTSEGEFWESLNTACNLKLPVVYLVEDNGYAISVPVEVNTAGGSISKLVRHFPDLLHPGSRRLRPARALRGDAARRAVRARAQGPGARAREGDPPVLALALRRRGAVPPGRGARGRRGARSADDVPGVARGRGARDRRGARGASRREVDAEVLAATDDALAQPQPDAEHGALRASTRPTSIRPASSSTPRTIRSSPASRRRWSTCSTRA